MTDRPATTATPICARASVDARLAAAPTAGIGATGVLGEGSSAGAGDSVGAEGAAMTSSMGSILPVSSRRRRCASNSAALADADGGAEDVGGKAGAGVVAGRGSGDVPDGATWGRSSTGSPLSGSRWVGNTGRGGSLVSGLLTTER